MHGLAELEHDEVGHIDHGVDGPQACPAQFLDHPQRRFGSAADVTNHTPYKARACFRSAHLDGKHRVACSRYRRDLRTRKNHVVQQSDLARDPQHTEAVAAVRRQIHVDDDVFQAQPGAQIGPNGRILRQVPEPLVSFAESQLALRTKHPLAGDATQLRPLDLQSAWQLPADQGHRRPHARVDIRRAANDFQGRLGTDLDLTDLQLVRIRMRRDTCDPADRHGRKCRGRGRGAVDLEPRHGELRDDPGRVHGRVHPLAEPALADFHRTAPWLNWRRKRKSLSKNSRKSLTP